MNMFQTQHWLLRRVRPWAATLAVAAFTMACATPGHEVPRPPSQAIDNPHETALGRSFASQLASTPGLSGFRLLPAGQEAFLVRAALAEAAQRTLDLQYHIVASDATGTALLYRALRAAQRGVRVRLLIDDLDVGDRDADLAAVAAHANVQVRVFNPFSTRSAAGLSRVLDYLSVGARLNRRMHNKLWIADNAAALIGGRNLGDAYFSADGQSNFADLDVLAVGPVVVEASRSFDEFWNSRWSVPIQAFTGAPPGPEQFEQAFAEMTARVAAFRDTDYVRELLASGLGQRVRSGQIELIAAPATVLHDSPDKLVARTTDQDEHVVARLRQAIEEAQHELVLVTPYFVPSELGIETLCRLARRGVPVRVLTNSLASTDVAAVHAGYARYRPRLLACGVALHELRPSVTGSGRLHRVLSSQRRAAPELTHPLGGRTTYTVGLGALSSGVSLHAKAIMVDRSAVLIGSMNLDPRSRLSNTEIAVRVESEALGRELGTWFDEATSLDRSFKVELSVAGREQAPLVWIGRDGDQPVRYTSEPLASWWQRFISGLLGAFVPESLL